MRFSDVRLSRRVASAAVVCVVLVGSATACTPSPDGPEPAAQAFLAAFSARDIGAASADTDRPDSAATALNDVWEDLQAESLDARTTSVRVDGDTATVGYS